MKFSIGQVSKIFDISKDTLRYYDKIGILTPEVNESNGYRYYLLKHLEKLELILSIKYLGISLSDIKNAIESENINEYESLVNKQEDIIDKKIKELMDLKKRVKRGRSILDKVSNFENNYDFKSIDVKEDSFTLYGLDTMNILNLDLYKNQELKLGRELDILGEEEYIYMYEIKDNKLLNENEEIVFVRESDKNKSLIKKYIKEEKIKFTKKIVKGKIAISEFYGSIDEIDKYVIDMNKYFKCSENNIAYMKYDFYLPKKNDNEEYFVEINLML